MATAAAPAAATTAASAINTRIAEARKAAAPFVQDFMKFIDASVSPYHACKTIASMLDGAGFTQISETEASTLRAPGSRHYVVRNQSSIIAVAVGGKYQSGNGVKIVGAHTDSPVLALRPKTAKTQNKHLCCAVQVYGGALLHTWFDRNLSCAGRVVVQKSGADAPLVSKLVDLGRKPLLRVPNLAIHLTKADEREAFKFNKEQHLMPVGATEAVAAALGVDKECTISDGRSGPHSGPLFAALAEKAGCTPAEILDFELNLYDVERATTVGFFDEFVTTARIDNILSCWAATRALLDTLDTQESDTMCRIASYYDHEEVGSESACGAGSSMLPDVLDRIFSGLEPAAVAAAKARSIQWSVDGGHAFHPNYADRHSDSNRPVLNTSGVAIKVNANQRYATNAKTAAIVKSVARRVDVPVDEFCVKNDSPCGSTIGPISSTLVGIPTVDIGAPMIAMHSISEMTGSLDVYWLQRLVGGFFSSTEQQLKIQEE
jgi:aspartyl aminopeptidase